MKKQIKKIIQNIKNIKLFFGRNPKSIMHRPALFFFPLKYNVFSCGISAIVAFEKKQSLKNLEILKDEAIIIKNPKKLKKNLEILKNDEHFIKAFVDKKYATKIKKLGDYIETQLKDIDILASKKNAKKKETLKDVAWYIKKEFLENIKNVKNLNCQKKSTISKIKIYKKINITLNNIDKLEVRGRDSAGISILFIFKKQIFKDILNKFLELGLKERFQNRSNQKILLNNSISVSRSYSHDNNYLRSISFTYKIAKEIGKLGDNVAYLRKQIKNDLVLNSIAEFPVFSQSIISHSRWASVGEISEPNCHPIDNNNKDNIIHICLNGDIDNFLELKEEYETSYENIEKKISTDAKIISLQIESYMDKGHNIEKSFLMSVADFEGSHAIAMHTSIAPNKIFLAQRGSGQTIFVGISNRNYVIASEIYGIIEETSSYIKINTKNPNKGEVFILNAKKGGIEGIKAFSYNETKRDIKKTDIKTTEINSRDIDRKSYPHYFLKEITESPQSVDNTIIDRWKKNKKYYEPNLDLAIITNDIKKAIITKKIKKLFFIGQGTAAIAANACANIAKHYLAEDSVQIESCTSSELSSLMVENKKKFKSLLLVAISQSGTTTDTNKTVDLAKEKDAKIIALVNKRDSDLTFKADGVMYTSNGRDIEMSVASTKAFYSQIIAGTLLSLQIACIKKTKSKKFISDEIKEILSISKKMKKVLLLKKNIQKSAIKYTSLNNYWATVGSGYNKVAADEIRIKLSELCYRTISSDIIEDKKHIDLSAEPLIIVCANGLKKNVINDITKEIAIFTAHKANTIVFANKDSKNFKNFAKSIFYLPNTNEHFAPIFATLAGHLFGYYAALTINDNSEVMNKCKIEIENIIEEYTKRNIDYYEILFKKRFKEKIIEIYEIFNQRRKDNLFPNIMSFSSGISLTLILKYLAGKLPISDFELDFGIKGTPDNLFKILFYCLNEITDSMARPIDAIKHQAKTVTVGTSREDTKIEGLLFDCLEKNKIDVSQIINKNIIVLKNLQNVVSKIEGTILYKIKDLSKLGEQTKKNKNSNIEKNRYIKRYSIKSRKR